MKRHSNLYNKICNLDNIRLAHQNAKKGKRFYSEVKMVDSNPNFYLQQIQQILLNEEFQTSQYEIFNRIEHGKERVIYKLPYYPDRIIHHCIMNILEPIWINTFIRDTYSSIKGRGIHDGVKRLKKFLKCSKETKYCLKFDIRKFYPSVNHIILKNIIRKTIKCKRTLNLLDGIIDSSEGVPIGNYLSQYFANLYLSYFDHWCKESLKIHYYLRYCDDIVILAANKIILWLYLNYIAIFLKDRLNLSIKKNWQIFPTSIRGIDFLGYRFFGDYTLVRKRIVKDFKNKVQHTMKFSSSYFVNMLASYRGWFQYGNTYNLSQLYIY